MRHDTTTIPQVQRNGFGKCKQVVTSGKRHSCEEKEAHARGCSESHRSASSAAAAPAPALVIAWQFNESSLTCQRYDMSRGGDAGTVGVDDLEVIVTRCTDREPHSFAFPSK
jgi:hypothetical protein